jgi:hypothetical protein
MRNYARIRAFGAASALLVGSAATSPRARADEPIAAGEPRVMRETGEITTVIDAFDDDDPFDANLVLGFRQSWKHASIRRETALSQPGLSTGGFVAQTENVASYTQSTSTLDLGADIGLFRDLALSVRLPLILSDARELTDLDGSSNVQSTRLADPVNGQQLFAVPFKSPARSGFDWFSVALNYAIMNQQRDETAPTWVIGAEGRFAIGARLHACNDAGVQIGGQTVRCPDPEHPGVDRDPGISRGMNAVVAHTVFSRRYGHVEPYSGFRFLAEFPQSNSDFGSASGLQGSLVNHPPLQGTFFLGLEIVPWERREQFQRLLADLRVKGTYVSPGREYTELFDALGSSQAPSLRTPNPGAWHTNPNVASDPSHPSVADPSAQPVFFTGITDQQAYGSFTASGEVTWQAGEYIKFAGGVALTYQQSHLITSADACNPDFRGDLTAAGPCRSVGNDPASGRQAMSATGIPNPNHRAVIDLPGRRFAADDTTIVDLWLRGIVMF